MRRAARRDTTHAEVRDAFRDLGCLVLELNGAIDLLVLENGVLSLVDCKTPKSKAGRITRTKTQQKLDAEGWPVIYVTSAERAVALVKAWRRAA
jgi:hypothetical protein